VRERRSTTQYTHTLMQQQQQYPHYKRRRESVWHALHYFAVGIGALIGIVIAGCHHATVVIRFSPHVTRVSWKHDHYCPSGDARSSWIMLLCTSLTGRFAPSSVRPLDVSPPSNGRPPWISTSLMSVQPVFIGSGNCDVSGDHWILSRVITSLCHDTVSARMGVVHLLLPAQLPGTHCMSDDLCDSTLSTDSFRGLLKTRLFSGCLSEKKHATTFSKITWTISVRLQ